MERASYENALLFHKILSDCNEMEYDANWISPQGLARPSIPMNSKVRNLSLMQYSNGIRLFISDLLVTAPMRTACGHPVLAIGRRTRNQYLPSSMLRGLMVSSGAKTMVSRLIVAQRTILSNAAACIHFNASRHSSQCSSGTSLNKATTINFHNQGQFPK